MSGLNQSLVRVYENEDGNAVIVYGNADNCDIQTLDLESIIINRKDVDDLANALLNIDLGEVD